MLISFCRETYSSPEGAGQNSPGRKPWARIKDPKSPEGAKQKVNDRNELRRPYRAYQTFYHCPRVSPWALLRRPFGTKTYVSRQKLINKFPVEKLRVGAKISLHSGASAGRTDARRRDAGDVVHPRVATTPQRPTRLRAPCKHSNLHIFTLGALRQAALCAKQLLHSVSNTTTIFYLVERECKNAIIVLNDFMSFGIFLDLNEMKL
jgi:hypothetical protein